MKGLMGLPLRQLAPFPNELIDSCHKVFQNGFIHIELELHEKLAVWLHYTTGCYSSLSNS